MSDYQTRNYTAHGGKETVIGGKLTFLPGAEVKHDRFRRRAENASAHPA